MPPKGSTKKRAAAAEAEGDTPSEQQSSGSGSLRRSTRGGGHPAAAEKPAQNSKPKSGSNSNKKAKTGNDVGAVTEGEPENGGAGVDADAGAAEVPANGKEQAENDGAQNGREASIAQENKEIADNSTAANKGGQKQRRLEVGESLPAGLVLKNENDEEVKVEELTREKGAVFFVYPKANTPGCTTQACTFRDQYEEFGPLGYDVFGLSGDSPKSQHSWKTKHSFPYHLLCDPGQILLSLLGAVKSPKSNQRSHYIVEKGGKIVDAKYTVSPKDSTRLALEFIKGQGKGQSEKNGKAGEKAVGADEGEKKEG